MKQQVIAIAALSALATGGSIWLFGNHESGPAGSGPQSALNSGASLPQIRAAVEKNPDDVILVKRLARAERQAGNLQAATTHYLTAARLAPGDVESNNALRALAGKSSR